MFVISKVALTLGSIGILSAASNGSKLMEARVVDEKYIMLRFADAIVHHVEAPSAPGWQQGHESRTDDVIEKFGNPLNVSEAQKTSNFSITSNSDKAYSSSKQPLKAFRKTKVSGTAWKWPDPDLTYEHTIFLELPTPMKQGSEYRIFIDNALQSEAKTASLKFDIFNSWSEALHVNIVASQANSPMKSADLYQWMGDGGARDYSAFFGKKVYLYDLNLKKSTPVGTVAFWKKQSKEFGNWDLTHSDVWTCDFSSFTKPGKYRLAVEGVGCSADFEIKNNAFFEPFKTSLRGFYFMRIGEPATVKPTPRQPQMIHGKEGFSVIMTTYSPWHPDWKKGKGDQWDVTDWSKYAEPGNPTNPNAYGGHSDALDWDRHLGHCVIIWDLLLPYLLSNGKGGEDNLGIPESGNGIPDIIDEARNEVDFWVRLRDRNGNYATGLNNPDKTHKKLYQAAARPYQAWQVAANCAMLANAFKIAGKNDLAMKYVKEAEEAWRRADGKDLDEFWTIGNGNARGRDHKMLAAACLFNVTGNTKYEDAVAEESVIKSPTSVTEEHNKSNQQWGTAAYLMCAKYKWQKIRYPQLVKNMTAAIIKEAIDKNVANSEKFPSRRSGDTAWGWFQAIQDTQKVCIAHAVAPDQVTKDRMLKALILEADWGLGRNPMNMVQMTGLGSRHPDYIYTSGRNDGFPECHPGHTPYMNSEPWGQDFMGNPRYYSSRGYPAWDQWPQGEALWRAPYCYSNNEFTPQQSMRGKHCMYAYLYTLGSPGK